MFQNRWPLAVRFELWRQQGGVAVVGQGGGGEGGGVAAEEQGASLGKIYIYFLKKY